MRCARPAVRMGQDPSLHFYPKKGFFYKLSFPQGGSLFCRSAASPPTAAEGPPEQPLYAVVFYLCALHGGAQIKKAPASGAENDGAKRNKQTAKGAEQNAETEAQPVIGRNRAGEAKQPAGSRLVMVSSC